MSLEPLEPVAIVGMGLRFPGADSPEAFWANLRDGRCFLGRSAARPASLDGTPRIHAPVARLDRVDGFDWRAFGVPPNQARFLDPQHRLLLEVVWESLEDAGIPTGSLEGSQTAVYVGIQWNDYLRLHSREPSRIDSYSLTGNLFHFAANRVSHVFGLQGPSMAIDMGCASSLAAVHSACQSLRLHETDVAIAGAVELVLSPDSTSMMERSGLLDERSDCRTFDAEARGFARGEGSGVMVMKRAADVRPEDRVYAWVLGTAVNHNGRNHWITAPSEEAQTHVLREAWRRSGISAHDLDYIELHGTASPSGDATEAAALGTAIGGRPKGSPALRVGSVKTQIGHLGAASGVAGLAKVALALHHREIPPGLRIDEPNRDIPFDSLGLDLQTELSAWPTKSGALLAGVTATSLSGANAHVVLQRPPERSERGRIGGDGPPPPTYFLPISARSRDALRDLCGRFRTYLTDCSAAMPDIAYSAGARREHFEFRFCAAGTTISDWIEALDDTLASGEQPADERKPSDSVRDAYLRGGDTDWAAHLPPGCRLVALPFYPWQRRSFWLPGASGTQEPVHEPAPSLDGAPLADAGPFVTEQLAAVLGLDRHEIVASASVAELGLDSLRALQVAHAVERSLGVQIPVPDLLERSVPAIIDQVRAALEATDPKPKLDGRHERAAESGPLSKGQQAFWFHHELAPNNPAPNIVLPLELRGRLDSSALCVAFEKAVERHPMLRVSFDMRDGKPFQRFNDPIEMPWTVVDASGLSPRALESQLVEEGHRPFDLRCRPPFRLTLYTGVRGPERNVLLVVIHHIAIDFWSLAILLDEVGHDYLEIVEKRPASLPPPTSTYSDFVEEERSVMNGLESEGTLAFWRKELSGLPPLTSLPTDRPRPAELSSQGASVVFEIDDALTTRIGWLARSEGATLFMTLLAAYRVLLHRFGGSADLAIGVPTFGRQRERFRRVVGYFVNPVVIRARVDGETSFHELLQSVSRNSLAALAHQEYPFPALVEKLRVQRSQSHHPLFQVMFAFQQSPLVNRPDLSAFALCDSGAKGSLGDLEMISIGLPNKAVQFDLNLMLAPAGRGLAATLEYNRTLFLPETARRLAEAYVEILDQVVENPQRPLREIGEARDEPHAEESKEPVQKQHGRSLCELFERQVELCKEATAVVAPRGEEIGYQELSRRATQVACHLLERGVRPGKVVGVCLPPSIELLVYALGVLKSGAALLSLDATHPPERIHWMLDDSGAMLVIADDEHREGLSCERMDPTKLTTRVAESSLPRVQGTDLAYIMYTSGSTGRPKGVMVPHEAIAKRVEWRELVVPLERTDRILLLASPSFDIFMWEFFGPLANGAQVVIASPDARRDRRLLAELIRERRVTVLQLVSSALAQLIDEPLFAQCESLRAVFCGGDPLLGGVAERFCKMHQGELVHLYGPTEAVIDATYYRYPRNGKKVTQVPIGRPVDGVKVHVLDDALRPVPRGAPGELCIGGKELAWGYLGKAGLTARQFVPDPFGSGERLYRTGDSVRLNETHELEFLGRRDEQTKIRGYRVELGEVEAAIGRLPNVRDQAVLTREEDGQKVLVAYVVFKPHDRVTTSALRKHLATTLPDYMMPADMVVVDEIARLPSGKVDRKRLADIEAGRARGGTEGGLRSYAEEMVAEAWSELLKRERVPPETSFFELGGHSLLALQVAARLTALTGVEVPVSAVFDRPTIRSLGAFIVERQRVAIHGPTVPNFLPLGEDEGPLSFAQEGLWLLEQLEPGRSTHTVSQAFRLEGRLDTKALERSISELVRRHESLRTTFLPQGDTAKQVIGPADPLTLPSEDLRSLGRDEARRTLSRLIKEEAHRAIDLTCGPLFRASVVRVHEEEHALLITLHHIICDGWSQSFLLEELSTLYRCFSNKEAVPVRESGLRYVDFARWEREWLEQDRHDRLADYWLTKLRGSTSTLLPMARRTALRPSEKAATCSRLLDTETIAPLQALCRKENATLFMGLVAAFAVLLHRYSGETDFVVGTPMSVRDLPELEQMVGNFVKLLPLRIQLTRALTFRDLLARVREESLQSYAHRQFPFGRIVKELQPERKANEIPLLNVVFQLASQPAATLRLAGVTVSPILSPLEVAPRYLNFTMTPREKGLDAQVDFAADRFDHSSMAGMLERYARTIDSVAAQPAVRLASVLRTLERSDNHRLDDGNRFAFERE